ncbi:MAG: sel1 repeat family protein [Gammaproteobacteria bacterium]|nr:sel1 repeat family protein [Gammaproteobacteria bacterium]MDA8002896.1 sel1 repeat family protein [Alphaproteobacteria bacterium]
MKNLWSKSVEKVGKPLLLSIKVLGVLAAFLAISYLLFLLHEHHPVIVYAVLSVLFLGALLVGAFWWFAALLAIFGIGFFWCVGFFAGLLRTFFPSLMWNDHADWSKSIASLRKHVERGDVDAQYKLAEMLRAAKGIRADMYKAEYWYRKAAEQGHAEAQYSMGVVAEYGHAEARWRLEKTASDRERMAEMMPEYAKVRWQQAAWAEFPTRKGFWAEASGWRTAGMKVWQRFWAYVTNALFTNMQASIRWHYRAAEQGHAKAQFSLCYAYWHGKSVAEDKREACVWWMVFKENADAEDDDKNVSDDDVSDLGFFLGRNWKHEISCETDLKFREMLRESRFIFPKSEILSIQKDATKRMKEIDRRKVQGE